MMESSILENQFGFMPRRSIIEAIFFFDELLEKGVKVVNLVDIEEKGASLRDIWRLFKTCMRGQLQV